MNVSVAFAQPCAAKLDVMQAKLFQASSEAAFTLAPQECVFYVESSEPFANAEEEKTYSVKELYTGSFRITRAAFTDKDTWMDCGETTQLYDIDRRYPGFAGTVRYDLHIEDDASALLLEEAQDAFEVFCDGVSLGKRIAPPYLWALPEGAAHDICIEHATTLVNAVVDDISCRRQIPPTGFMGRVLILK